MPLTCWVRSPKKERGPGARDSKTALKVRRSRSDQAANPPRENAALGPIEQEAPARWATFRVLMGGLAHPKEKCRVIRPERSTAITIKGTACPGPTLDRPSERRRGVADGLLAQRAACRNTGSSGSNAYFTAFAVGHMAFVSLGHEVEDGATVISARDEALSGRSGQPSPT